MASEKSTLDGLRIERGADSAEGSRAKLWGTLGLVAVLLGAGLWFFVGRPHGKPVRVAAVHAVPTGAAGTVLNASGYVTARRAATVSSKVTGKVSQVLIEEGMAVQSGQVLARLDDATLRAALRETSIAELTAGTPDGIVDLLVASGLAPSKGAARRTIAEGGAYVNNTKIDDEAWAPQPTDFLHGRWLVLRRGKRNIAGVERVG